MKIIPIIAGMAVGLLVHLMSPKAKSTLGGTLLAATMTSTVISSQLADKNKK